MIRSVDEQRHFLRSSYPLCLRSIALIEEERRRLPIKKQKKRKKTHPKEGI